MHVKGNYEVQVDGNKNEVIKGTISQTVTGNVTETYSKSKQQRLQETWMLMQQVDLN